MRWTRVPEGDPGLHMDPITKETFTNASKLVVLAATGWVAEVGNGWCQVLVLGRWRLIDL